MRPDLIAPGSVVDDVCVLHAVSVSPGLYIDLGRCPTDHGWALAPPSSIHQSEHLPRHDGADAS